MGKAKRILFIGDSITDAGRFGDEMGIGTGYVRLLHDYFQVTYPEKEITIINQGIGGNRVTDLRARWQEDVISLEPDILSISIGINDVWRQLDNNEIEQVYPDQFESIYSALLLQVKKETNAEIVLLEPTIIEEDLHSKGNQLLKPYVDIVHKLATRYQAHVVPLHEVFLDYLSKRSDAPLTTDGVHMNSSGNMLMAKAWLQSVGQIVRESIE